jgi:hypothetical protein
MTLRRCQRCNIEQPCGEKIGQLRDTTDCPSECTDTYKRKLAASVKYGYMNNPWMYVKKPDEN